MSQGTTWTNYYEILNVPKESSAREIASAYRLKALRYHPDKNVNNPQLVNKFHELTKAYQVLIDPEARQAFDAVIAGRVAKKERDESLDARRKSMRDELLRREWEAKKRKVDESEAEIRLTREMERVKREAAAAEEAERLRKAGEDREKPAYFDEMDRTLKLTFTTPMTEEKVMSFVKGYGKAESLILSKKRTSGVLQLDSVFTAKAIVMDSGRNVIDKVLAEWAKGSPPSLEVRSKTLSAGDFESLTLMKMRQKAERARMRATLEEESNSTDRVNCDRDNAASNDSDNNNKVP